MLVILVSIVLVGCARVAEVSPATQILSPTPVSVPTPKPPEGPYARIYTRAGKEVFLRLEVADSAEEKAIGLSKRSYLPADAGMVFVYNEDHLGAFWMKDTWIPLSIAFLSSDGRIQEIQDMEPNTTDSHVPAYSYRNALEVNLGYFEMNGINVGDRVDLRLGGNQ